MIEFHLLHLALLFGLVALTCGCSERAGSMSNSVKSQQTSEVVAAVSKDRDTAVRRGTHYSLPLGTKETKVTAERIGIPDFPGTFAIWGGSGRCDDGKILLGISTVWTEAAQQPSAHAYMLEPATQNLAFVGDVVSVLKSKGQIHEATLRLGAGGIVADDQPGEPTLCRESQMKIHSKFVTMDDGWTYFTSMDEWNEKEDGSQLPHWGSHLWRLNANNPQQWEHLKAVPEALVAISGVGRYVFALGYFNHVVYRYDTVGGDWKRVEVGAPGGHISRNLVSNDAGHVFVPRVQGATAKDPSTAPQAELVEFDADLNELQRTTLAHYPITADTGSHGITGFAYLANSDIVMLTSSGFLYRIKRDPNDESMVKPSLVEEIGWLEGNSESYAASLFPIDGDRLLGAAVVNSDVSTMRWVSYDLSTKVSISVPLVISNPPDHGMIKIMLYGSNTRDDQGRCYVVGAYRIADGARQFPLCLQVSLD